MSFFGKLIYNAYYRPRQERAMLQKFGGRRSYEAMLRAEQEMKQHALNELSIARAFNSQGKYRINFLTGDRFIHQSLFCTYSFFKFLSEEEASNFSVNYYSDGSLNLETISIFQSRFPSINIIDQQQIKSGLDKYLPVGQFPYIHKKMAVYPPIKKLLYPNLYQKGISIFFDSDMLFLKRPEAFLDWLYTKGEQCNSAFGIPDVQRSYGYTDSQITKFYPTGILHNINSGMYAMHSEKINMLFVEELLNKFETAYGSQYYIEQLITAIILEQSPDLFMAPANDYIVLPNFLQFTEQQGVLHHYVNESKEYYFKEGWRRQLIDSSPLLRS